LRLPPKVKGGPAKGRTRNKARRKAEKSGGETITNNESGAIENKTKAGYRKRMRRRNRWQKKKDHQKDHKRGNAVQIITTKKGDRTPKKALYEGGQSVLQREGWRPVREAKRKRKKGENAVARTLPVY